MHQALYAHMNNKRKKKISGMILRSLIHFELIVVQGARHGSSYSFLQQQKTSFPSNIC
jgi:hypothetical protein